MAIKALSTYVLRSATSADAQTLCTLACDTFTETFGHLYAPADLQAHLDDACSATFFAQALTAPNVHAIIASCDGVDVGYALWESLTLYVEDAPSDSMQLQRLYVCAEHHGKGVGVMLMEEALQAMADAPAIYLGVWENNYKAQAFYTRYGFTHVSDHTFLVGEHVDRDLIWVRHNIAS